MAEAIVYLPLGRNDVGTMFPRVGLALLVVVGVVLLATGWRRVAALVGAVAVAAYGWLVVASSDGLPRRFEADTPPPFLAWLLNALLLAFFYLGDRPWQRYAVLTLMHPVVEPEA